MLILSKEAAKQASVLTLSRFQLAISRPTSTTDQTIVATFSDKHLSRYTSAGLNYGRVSTKAQCDKVDVHLKKALSLKRYMMAKKNI